MKTAMFRCKTCESGEFKLMLQPGFSGQVDISTNEHDEVLIHVDGKTFIADLLFMNQFAMCQSCETINNWAYSFPATSDKGS